MLTGAIVLFSCSDSKKSKAKLNTDLESVGLRFSFEIDKEVCQGTKYKRTPQIAIWLENAKTGDIQTVCVTYKTAKGRWGGDITRPVCLPWWTKKWNTETGTSGEPSVRQPVVDAVTAPTPKAEFTRAIEVNRGSKWNYFIEVNVSGDFNETFAETSSAGTKDKHANGQPSIIYKGTITAEPENSDTPKVIARTDQFKIVDTLITDMQGITTADKLLKEIEITCTAIIH
jgi:hypothetical protein